MFALALARLPAEGAAQAPTASRIAITNVNVIPMDRERVLPRHTVLIENGVITASSAR